MTLTRGDTFDLTETFLESAYQLAFMSSPFHSIRLASQSSDSLLKFHLPSLFPTQAFHPTKLLYI